MSDAERSTERRPVLHTRGSVGAARFLFVVVIWPILSIVVAFVLLVCVMAIVTTLYPELGQRGSGAGDLVGLVFGAPVFLVSAVLAAVACKTIYRHMTSLE